MRCILIVLILNITALKAQVGNISPQKIYKENLTFTDTAAISQILILIHQNALNGKIKSFKEYQLITLLDTNYLKKLGGICEVVSNDYSKSDITDSVNCWDYNSEQIKEFSVFYKTKIRPDFPYSVGIHISTIINNVEKRSEYWIDFASLQNLLYENQNKIFLKSIN